MNKRSGRKKACQWQRLFWQLLGVVAISAVCYWQGQEGALLSEAMEPQRVESKAAPKNDGQIAELKATIAKLRKLKATNEAVKPKQTTTKTETTTTIAQLRATIEEKETEIDHLKREVYTARKTALQIEKAANKELMKEVKKVTDTWRREAGEKLKDRKKRKAPQGTALVKQPVQRQQPKKGRCRDESKNFCVLSHTPCLAAEEVARTDERRTNYPLDDRNLDACRANQTTLLKKKQAMVLYSHELAADANPFCVLAQQAVGGSDSAGGEGSDSADDTVADDDRLAGGRGSDLGFECNALGIRRIDPPTLIDRSGLRYVTTTEPLPPAPWEAVSSQEMNVFIGVRHPVTTLLLKFPDPNHTITSSDLDVLSENSLTRHLAGVDPEVLKVCTIPPPLHLYHLSSHLLHPPLSLSSLLSPPPPPSISIISPLLHPPDVLKVSFKMKNLAINRLKRAALVVIQEWQHESTLAVCAALGWSSGGGEWGPTVCVFKSTLNSTRTPYSLHTPHSTSHRLLLDTPLSPTPLLTRLLLHTPFSPTPLLTRLLLHTLLLHSPLALSR
jgi:hypothetical protein